MSSSGYRLVIKESHLPLVVFPALPADGPDVDDDRVRQVRIRL